MSLLDPQPMAPDEVAGMVERARKKHTCTLCDETGHNARTCPDRALVVAPHPRPPRARRGKSYEAALLVRDKGLTMQQAADRCGVTRLAVQQAWTVLFPGSLTATVENQGWRRWQAISLLMDGADAAEAADASGLAHNSVHVICRRAGLELAHTSAEVRGEIDEAAMAVARGGSVTEAAIDAGVGRAVLQRAIAKRGVKSTAVRGPNGGRNGGVARAWALVEQGMSIPEAARRERIASSNLYMKRARLKREAAGGVR